MPRNPSRRYIRSKAGTTGITSAGQAVITAADAAAIRFVLDLVLGTNVLAPNGNGSALTGLTQSQISGLVAALAAKADAAATTSALAGKADLSGGKILTSQIPALAIVEFLGSVASQSAMLALDGDRGDWCIRTDAQTAYILTADDSTQVGSWIALPHPTSPVLSVNGQSGVIVLGASDVGAQPVDATLTALAGVTTSANSLIYATGSDTFSTTTLSAFARTFLDDADAAAVLATLGAQPLASILTAIANVGGSVVANRLLYTTATNTWATTGINADARTFLAQANWANMRSVLGVALDVICIHDTAPVVGVIYLDAKAQYSRTINGLYGLRTTSGTCTITVKINGTPVTGLSAISVTSTPQDATASGSGTISAGDVLTLEYTAVSSPIDMRATLKATI